MRITLGPLVDNSGGIIKKREKKKGGPVLPSTFSVSQRLAGRQEAVSEQEEK